MTDIPTSNQSRGALQPIALCKPFAASSKSSRNILMLMQRCAATSGTKSSTLLKAQKQKHVQHPSDPCSPGLRRCGRRPLCGMDFRCDSFQRMNYLRKQRVARSGSLWSIRAGTDTTKECLCRPSECWIPTTFSPYGGKCLGMSIHLCS
jgi:hypothetical protein